MFCPECGGSKWENLYGGSCSMRCVYCGKAIYCRDLCSDEISSDSLPVRNPIKALKLRRAYNKVPGNKERGQKNLKANEAFHRKMAEDARKAREHRRELQEQIDNPLPMELKEFEGTLEEFIEQVKKRKQNEQEEV